MSSMPNDMPSTEVRNSLIQEAKYMFPYVHRHAFYAEYQMEAGALGSHWARNQFVLLDVGAACVLKVRVDGPSR